MSLNSLNIKPKCYKVIVNLLDLDSAYQAKDFTEQLKLEDNEEILSQMNEYYTSPDNVKQMVFLFVGDFDDTIKALLGNITNNKSFKSLSESDKETLNSYFNYDIQDNWDILNNINVTKIHFVPYLIHDFDNISYLHTFLSCVISNFTKDSEVFYRQLVKTSDMFIYTKSDLYIDQDLHNFKQQILMVHKNKSYSFNLTILENKLLNIGFDKRIIELIFNKYESDPNRITEILDNSLLENLYKLYKSFIPITLYVKNKKDFEFNSTNILDKIYGNPKDISDDIYKIDNALFNEQLRNITDNTELYLYTQINVTRFITGLEDENLDKYFGKLYKYYFYETKKKDLNGLIGKNTIDTQIYKNIISKYDELSYYVKTLDTFNIFEQNDDNDSLLINDIQPKIINIKSHLNFPNNYNFIELFNNINLNLDIPFTKFRDTIANDIVFKIYKPITYSDSSGYIPIVSLDELNNWIKYKNYEVDNFKIKRIKSNPREVFFKLKVANFYTNNLVNGIVNKVNIYDDETITYDINIGSSIISGVDHIHGDVKLNEIEEEDSKNIVQGSDVSFKNKITIYADLEIYKKGFLNLSIDASKFENEDIEDIMFKIIGSLNNFIKTIYEEDRNLVQYQQFKPEFNIVNYINNNKFNLTELLDTNLYSNDTVSINTQNNYKLNWYNTYDVLEMLYPLIEIPEDIFEKGDNVVYQDKEGAADDTFDAKILLVNEGDNTYNISYKDGAITKTLDKINSRFLSKKDNYDKSIVTLYFKTNKGLGYDKSNEIFTFIDKSRITGYNTKEIVDRLRDNFKEKISTPQDAQDKLQDFLSKTGLNARTFSNNIDTNPQITLNLSSIRENLEYEGSLPTYSMEIYIENISDYNTYLQVTKFVSFFFEVYNYKFHNDKNSNIHIKSLMNYSTNPKVSHDSKKNTDTLQAPVTAETTKIGQDMFAVELEGSDFDDSDDEEDDDDDTIIDNENEFKEIFKNDSMIVGQSRLTKNIILDNLYSKDSGLFGWENKENPRKTYTGICQGTRRYPKVLTNEQKEDIDKRDSKYFNNQSTSDVWLSKKNYNDIVENIPEYIREDINSRSYNAGINDKSDCENSETLPKDNKCSAIKYGSTSEKNWYICPKIFDVKDNVPLHWTMLDYISIEGNTFIPKDYNDIQYWRVDKNTNKDIVEYKPTYKNRGIINTKSSKIAATPRNSLILLEKSSAYAYPGFLNNKQNPKGYYTPCCFKSSSKKVQSAFNPNQLSKDVRKHNNYIQGYSKDLGYSPRRIGILPVDISEKLGNNLDICTTGDMSDKKKCFFRMGNQPGSDSFLAMMSDIFFDKLNPTSSKDYIVTTLEKEIFDTLNGGSIDIKFRNYGKQSSFQNFMEYTLSDEDKDFRLYYEYFTYWTQNLQQNSGSIKKIVTKDRNFDDNKSSISPYIFHLIFDTKFVKEDGIIKVKHEVICPYFMKNIYDFNDLKYFTMSIKNKDSFEPIFYFKGNNTPVKIFEKWRKIKEGEDEKKYNAYYNRLLPFKNASIIIDKILNTCKSGVKSDIINISKYLGENGPNIELTNQQYNLFNIFQFFYSLYTSFPSDAFKYIQYKPDYLLIDDYNRIYGIILNNKTIIPLYPQIVDRNLIYIFNNSSVNNYKVTIKDTGEEVLINYAKITNKSNQKTHINVDDEVTIKYKGKQDILATVIEVIDFKFDISFKYSRNIDYTPTSLKDHIELYTFMKKISEKLSSGFIFDIKPVYYFQDKKNNTITGFITNTGSYIKITPESKSDRLTKIIDNNYYDVDKSIIDYQKAFFDEIYEEPSTFAKLLQELETINSDTVIELFTFDNIYITQYNKIIGITTNNGIYIPLKNEDIGEYNDIIINKGIVKNIDVEFIINGDSSIISDYIDMSKNMTKILDYSVPFSVKGFLLDDSKVIFNKIILNTGHAIDLSSYLSFEATSKSINGKYTINNLLDKLFIEQATDKILNKMPLSNKDKLISKFNYTSNIYNASKYCIFKLLQKSQYRMIRNFLKQVVSSIEINNFIKKISIIPIIDILFNILIAYDHNIPDIYPNISIDNVGNLDKCNGKYIVSTSNSDLITKMSKIGNINDYLKLSINLIFGEITAGNIEKIKLMLNINSQENDLDTLIQDMLLNISDNDRVFIETLSISNYNSLIDQIPKKSCKLQVYTIGNNIKINKIKLIDELIQNNYSKIQILDNFRILSNTERYRFNSNLEIFLSNKDLNSKNRIAELYKSIKKLYYRNVLDFDNTDFISNYSILGKEETKRIITDKCNIVFDSVKEVKIIQSKSKLLKNTSNILSAQCKQNMRITRCKTLTEKEIFNIYKMNTELDRCISEYSQSITIKFVKNKDGGDKVKDLIYNSR
jgi:hypothetical protein